MININLFVEDEAHEVFLNALIHRFANDHEVIINIKASSVRGGYGKTISELEQYQRDLLRNKEYLPDLVIVATDSNCKGFSERERSIKQASADLGNLVISMIPEPHIERWLLLDPVAFKKVLGKGCPIPDQKCERGRYKRQLLKAISNAGVTPLLGGIEHTEDLVSAMNFQRAAQIDKSIDKFLKELRRRFRTWQQTATTK